MGSQHNVTGHGVLGVRYYRRTRRRDPDNSGTFAARCNELHQSRPAAISSYSKGFFSQLVFIYQMYWERIVEISVFFGVAGGAASLAVAFGPHGFQSAKSIFTSWNGRIAIIANTLCLLNGTVYGLLAYLTVRSILLAYLTLRSPLSSPGYLEVLCPLAFGLAFGLATGWASANDRFRSGTPVVMVVGAIVGAPFYLYMGYSQSYGDIGLPVGMIGGLLAGLAALAVPVEGEIDTIHRVRYAGGLAAFSAFSRLVPRLRFLQKVSQIGFRSG